MTTKRDHLPCSAECAAFRSAQKSSPVPLPGHLATCPALYPAQQEPDALTRLVRLIRMGPESGSIAHRDLFAAKAMDLIHEARDEHRKALVRARNEGLEKARISLLERAVDMDAKGNPNATAWDDASEWVGGMKERES